MSTPQSPLGPGGNLTSQLIIRCAPCFEKQTGVKAMLWLFLLLLLVSTALQVLDFSEGGERINLKSSSSL